MKTERAGFEPAIRLPVCQISSGGRHIGAHSRGVSNRAVTTSKAEISSAPESGIGASQHKVSHNLGTVRSCVDSELVLAAYTAVRLAKAVRR